MPSFWKCAALVLCAVAAIGWPAQGAYADHAEPTEDVATIRVRAQQGDAAAQCDLANLYYHGRGVIQDYSEALRWYRKAADQSYPRGENGVALMYSQGQGVSQDYTAAVRWYRTAADQGYAPAEYNLGNMYYYGRGVPWDRREAQRWYQKAALFSRSPISS